MRQSVRRAVLSGVGVAAMVAGAAAADPSPRLKTAQDLARAHEVWAPGRDWSTANRAKVADLIVPALHRCVPDEADDQGELTAFSAYLRLSQKGRILEVVTDLDADLDRCMTKETTKVQLPQAPREDFWIQVNLAAML
jgi:hypothetical protein